MWVDYAPVYERVTSVLRDEVGVDMVRAVHTIDASGIRHILDEHGVGNETREGHIPVTQDDINNLPDIISSADSIKYAGKNKSGLDVIRYQKRINGHLFFVEEIRTGRNKLAAQSIWKIEATNKKSSPALGSTSETLLPRKQTPRAGEDFHQDYTTSEGNINPNPEGVRVHSSRETEKKVACSLIVSRYKKR